MNWRVVTVLAAALSRCGVTFFNEEAAGKGHDPDFVGSAKKANELNVQLAVEVHHNASASHDGFGCEICVHGDTSESNRQLGRRIAALLHQQLGLTIRRGDGLNVDSGLAFLWSTSMPALIPEISFIDNPPTGRSPVAPTTPPRRAKPSPRPSASTSANRM